MDERLFIEAAARVLTLKLQLGDTRPMKDVFSRDWRTHQAFVMALYEKSVHVARNSTNLLPIPQGTPFMALTEE